MDREAIAELFAAYGPVSAKRMFSGFGLYAEEVCFCLVLRGGEFYLKADEQTFARFEAENCKPFSYPKRSTGKVVSINSFWRMPERLYDDPDELADWTRAAVAAAHRAQLAKRRRAGSKKTGAKAKTPPAKGKAAKRAKKV
jgi:DNA transformation protein